MYKLKILVVDDEQLLRNLYQQRLAETGYEVETAANGKEAITKLSKKNYDVVMTDLKMPGEKDGIKVLEAAKEEDAETDVIIMTAFASVDTAIDAMRKGATDYLCKPFDFDELLIRLDKIAQKKELLRAFLSVEQNKEYGMLHMKDIAVKLHQKCLRAEKILRKEEVDIEERVQKVLTLLSK